MTVDLETEREPSGSRFPVPYIVWDVLSVVIAAAVLVAFIVSEDLPSVFWTGFGFRSTIVLLAASAIWMTVRVGVPNLAVAGIAAVGALTGADVVGEDGSTTALLAIAVGVGLAVGAVLVLLVVGLRIPAWAASLGMVGLLVGVSFRLFDGGQVLRAPRSDTLLDGGVAVFAVAVSFTLVIGVAALFVHSGDRRHLGWPDGATMLLQGGALLLSSALAGLAGGLLAVFTGSAQASGFDFARPFAIVLLGAASLRGRASGVLALVAATLIVQTSTTWLTFSDTDFADEYLLVGVVAMIGLVIGAILELTGTRPDDSFHDSATASSGPGTTTFTPPPPPPAPSAPSPSPPPPVPSPASSPASSAPSSSGDGTPD